jgi:hypothetical protein
VKRSAAEANEVHDQLAAYKRPDGVSALQGGRSLPKQRLVEFQENWSPAARLLACASGASLVILESATPSDDRANGAGSALFVRGASNMALKRFLAGESARDRGSENAAHRRADRAGRGDSGLQNQRSTGLANGLSLEIDHAGIMRLQPEREGMRLNVHVSYSPPAGALGHAIAAAADGATFIGGAGCGGPIGTKFDRRNSVRTTSPAMNLQRASATKPPTVLPPFGYVIEKRKRSCGVVKS